jgi:hypothetical protein
MTIPPIMRHGRIGDTGRSSEKHLSRRLGGRLRPASGAMAGAKGDIEIGTVLMEAKSTINDSMGLKFAWLAKIAAEARAVAKTPAIAISFIRGDGRPIDDGAWVLVPERVWRELVKEEKDSDSEQGQA